jgi:Domain of unknown function (DUF6378)
VNPRDCADLKLARLENQPDHMDSWVDLAGYAACDAEIAVDGPAQVTATALWPRSFARISHGSVRHVLHLFAPLNTSAMRTSLATVVDFIDEIRKRPGGAIHRAFPCRANTLSL